MSLPQIGDINLAFATLFLQRQLADMLPHNAALADLAHSLRAAPAHIPNSNYGGWQSDKSVFERDEPPIAALRQHITNAVRDLSTLPLRGRAANLRVRARLDGWINVIAPGDYNSPHFHAGSTWSGVYYVRAGTPGPAERPNSGAIEFLDPRAATEMVAGSQSHAQRLIVMPRDAMLLVFPGYLGHFVHPYHGTGERISIAFNCAVSVAEENVAVAPSLAPAPMPAPAPPPLASQSQHTLTPQTGGRS